MKSAKNGVELKKACRCRGKSTGHYPKIDGCVVPVAFGMLLGLVPVVKCDKCGKRWKKVKVTSKVKTCSKGKLAAK